MVSKDMLSDLPLFDNLTDEELADLAKVAQLKNYLEGEIIFSEGDAGGHLCVLRSGTVRITKRIRNSEKQTFALLKEKDFFGSLSFLSSREHSATAEALRDTQLIVLDKKGFEQFIQISPTASYKILKKIALYICSLLRQMDEKFIDMIKFVWEFGVKG